MSKIRFIRHVSALLTAAALPLCAGSLNMVQQQSQNEGINVLPAPGPVTVDADLADWDFSGRIWVFADKAVRPRYSVQAAAMWDRNYLYLGATWNDPTPMFSTIDPKFNPEQGWRADSWQIRLKTDRINHLTTWFYTEGKQPVVHLSGAAAGGKGIVLPLDEANGVRIAYRKNADGKGFTQEIRVPWAILYETVPDLAPGLVFRMGMEFLWGDASGGKGWPAHRYADNMQPGVTSREFYWSNWKAWGNATLLETGNIPLRRYEEKGGKLAGTIPVTVQLPPGATRFTVAIEDEQGRRIRNLGGDLTVDDYLVSRTDEFQTVEVLWDGLDDDGALVAAGNYRVVGLSHQGFGAVYDMCFYNPGTPAWNTSDGTGAWGSDHHDPLRVARAGDRMIISWKGAEGGSGLIGVGPDGKKLWGEARGAEQLAADNSHVYAYTHNHFTHQQYLFRLDAATGAYRPFVRNGQPLKFEYPLSDIVDLADDEEITGMAAADGRLFLSLSGGRIILVDATSATLIKTLDVSAPSALAATPDGDLVALLDGKLSRIHLETGKVEPIRTRGVANPVALATDLRGNVLVADRGAHSQIKAFSRRGKQLYACGRKGGRPLRGKFDKQAMLAMSSVAVDAQGNVWVVESWQNPRRVSVWSPKTGRLVREYVGNSAYSGTGSYLDEDDPDAAFVGALKLKLDRQNRTSQVDEVLWVPDPDKNEGFPLWVHAHWFSNPVFVKSSASGREIKYLYSNGMHAAFHAIYQKVGAAWQPVAAITSVKELKQQIPGLDLTGKGDDLGVFWNDYNGNAAVELDECRFHSGKLALHTYWGCKPGSDLSLYLCLDRDTYRYQPIAFRADGAPVYGPDGMRKIKLRTYKESVPVLEENLILNLGGDAKNGGHVQAFTPDGDRLLWRYPNPYPGVHGSHNAPMPKDGLLIGALKICGVAKVNDRVGRVFLMRGNLGQDFIMTTDGLYAGAMFRDGRIPGDGLPADEAELKNMDMADLSHGSEPFNGWFGRQKDGKIRMTCGLPGQAGMIAEVTGLEQIRRFEAPPVTVDQLTLVKADRENAARLTRITAPKEYGIAATPGRPGARDWGTFKGVKLMREGQPVQGVAKLAWDKQNLYAQFTVNDPTPWKNQGKDYTKLFKTGDCVDIQLSPSGNQGPNPVAGDLRVVISQLDGKPVAVLMQPLANTATPSEAVNYHSPVGDKAFQKVAVLADAQVSVKLAAGRYVVDAAIPWQALGMTPRKGLKLRGDCGFILSDSQGLINTARVYWANPDTNLVSDMPIEAWLAPDRWGGLGLD